VAPQAGVLESAAPGLHGSSTEGVKTGFPANTSVAKVTADYTLIKKKTKVSSYIRQFRDWL
jgi:hypothetical protein